ncbi:MAG: glycerol acyltransferase [Sphingobacteriaceae bacterium]|nr:MAG: glycerol acyltransferase [Sphingobacteriaceae bacterium]
MIIKSKPLHPFFFKCGALIIKQLLRRRFKKLNIKPVDIKPNHSYLLMCNHFSFLDGFLAYHLANEVLWKKDGMRKLYIMSLKDQMRKNPWLRYVGSFSVDPRKLSILESFEYAAEVLSTPGNVLLFYPQAWLESCHIRHIHFEEGLYEIVTRIKGDCQLLWSSNIIEFFESASPTMYFNMLDCGTNNDFDFDAVKKQVNRHHRKSLEQHIRFTSEPIEYKD